MRSFAVKDLEAILRRIDGRGYKAYKDLQGRSFRFREFDLRVEHVQGDPYAAPSRVRALVPLEVADLPRSSLATPARHRATRDYLARAFRGAGRGHREISIDAGRQTVLDRSACLIDDTTVDIRFTVDLPGAGRRILGRKAATLLLEALPAIIEASVMARNLDLADLEAHAATVEDQASLRSVLAEDEAVLIEKWRRRERDFSVTFEIDESASVSGLGIHEVINSADGALIGALFEKRRDQGRRHVSQAASLGGQIAGVAAHPIGQIGDLGGNHEDAGVFPGSGHRFLHRQSAPRPRWFDRL